VSKEIKQPAEILDCSLPGAGFPLPPDHPTRNPKSRVTQRTQPKRSVVKLSLPNKCQKFHLESTLRQAGAVFKAGGLSLIWWTTPVTAVLNVAACWLSAWQSDSCSLEQKLKLWAALGGFWHQRVCAALIKVFCSARITSPGTAPGLYQATQKHGFGSQLSNCSCCSHHGSLRRSNWRQPCPGESYTESCCCFLCCHILTGSSFSTHSTPCTAGHLSPTSPKQTRLSSTNACSRAEHRAAPCAPQQSTPAVKQSSGLGQGGSNGQRFVTFGCYGTADGGEASTEALDCQNLVRFSNKLDIHVRELTPKPRFE